MGETSPAVWFFLVGFTLITTDAQRYSRKTPSPSRGSLGWGWVDARRNTPHPHPNPPPPLEGEGIALIARHEKWGGQRRA